MKGVYCVIAALGEGKRIKVGSLGEIEFPAGVYVYVGSGMAGVEQRIERHGRKQKRKRWHIDYLMEEAEFIASAAIPCEAKEVECAAALSLGHADGAVGTVKGFGCSDCNCDSHLIYFGDVDPEWVAEAISLRLSMLDCVYPSKDNGRRWAARDRE
ncbi:MAG: GIY-YIG nuclease family protein [Candidatus Thermoplasmatota archaeon]|nr:GIY-YIG nuclease family protein [Candidatus Thermoplasmatota archaeon]